MIIIKCEDELLMLSGNAYIKAIKIDIPDNDKELTGKLDIYCQEDVYKRQAEYRAAQRH